MCGLQSAPSSTLHGGTGRALPGDQETGVSSSEEPPRPSSPGGPTLNPAGHFPGGLGRYPRADTVDEPEEMALFNSHCSFPDPRRAGVQAFRGCPAEGALCSCPEGLLVSAVLL